VNQARAVWQYQHVLTLSRLLPPSPTPPGSGCLPLHTTCYDWPSAELFQLRTVKQRLVAHAGVLPVLGAEAPAVRVPLPSNNCRLTSSTASPQRLVHRSRDHRWGNYVSVERGATACSIPISMPVFRQS
jgi:hypothetical protein